jgi:2-dehydro-3-deoxyphosphogluconate aldolase/(4S)-4-hydroxy-2-oxoglutarate aldolase
MKAAVARALIEEHGIIPSVRVRSTDDARFVAETIIQAGIPVVEITMTVPEAPELITELRQRFPTVVVGAGTLLDMEIAHQCVGAGALFLTTPGLDVHIVELALHEGVLAMPGALTPTEITIAARTGADLIKIFPCAPLGGPSYIRALKKPFPHVPLVASGGVNQNTAAEFIAAGAAAVGVGTELVPREAVYRRDQHWITELAHRFLSFIQDARDHVSGLRAD